MRTYSLRPWQQDYFQQAVLRVLTNTPDITCPEKFRSYMWTAVANGEKDRRRHLKKAAEAREFIRSEDIIPDEELTPQLNLLQYKDCMPPKQWEALSLVHLEGYTGIEAAAYLNVGRRVVEYRVYRAKQILKDLITIE